MKLNLLAKTDQVVTTICNSFAPVSLKELSAKLQIPVPTLSRICNDLAELHWLEKTDYHHFVPGLALIRFGDCATRLSPYAAAVETLLRDYAVKSGLNGFLAGYSGGRYFTIMRCAQSGSDEDIFRRSGILTALLSVSGLEQNDAKEELLRYLPELSDVEKNAFDREFEQLKFRKLLLRVGIMRQWYITVPFSRENSSYAVTFYGYGSKDKSVETVCTEVEQTVGRIISAWNRISGE